MKVALLSGGSGGAKLARALRDRCELSVIANTGDDIEIYGAHVSPDPDLVTYWLADRIDERGWGLAGDSFVVMDALRELGVEVWFQLGDRDLAVCIERRRLLEEGRTLTEALASLGDSLGLQARVLPMSEEPVRTRVRTPEGWLGLQEFLIATRGQAPIEQVEFSGAEDASPSPAVLAALANADAILIGPSNPIISIGPILALGELRDALLAADAPVLAVSPIVAGQVLKGPTAACMAWAGLTCDAAGIANCYAGLLDGIVTDEPSPGSSRGQAALPVLECSTLMDDAGAGEQLATRVLDFAAELRA